MITKMTTQIEIRRFQLTNLRIPFKLSFRHASAERSEASSVWIEAVSETGLVGYGEGCPRPYVTGETLETAAAFFARHEGDLRERVRDLGSLRAWMGAHTHDLDANPAAWCALELAILDLLARASDQAIEAFLSLPELGGCFNYTAVVGDAGREGFEAMVDGYRRWGFTDVKIKLSGDLERDREKIAVLRTWGGASLRVRVDANNLWESADEAIAFLRGLDFPWFAVEEPIRARDYVGLARVGEVLGCKIVLDESFQRIAQLDSLRADPDRWIVNLRVSKMGGLIRSLDVAAAALDASIGLIVGAQVGETSLLTRVALTVAQAARAGLVGQEGAFGTLLLAYDVCDPPLMFGPGGRLEIAHYPQLCAPGFGIAVSSVP